MKAAKYLVLTLLLACAQVLAASIPGVSASDEKQFQQFLNGIPAQYQAAYQKPLSKELQTEISNLQLQPKTIETYNRDFGTDITLENSVGHQEYEQLHHSHTALQKYKKTTSKPHITITFNQLLDIYSRNLPVWMARNAYKQNAKLLEPIEKKYGVPTSITLAILGCETGWGDDIGDFRILDSLATLAFKAPKARQQMYLNNLLSFINMLTYITSLDTDKIYVSTFDGGMGIPQFEPKNYAKYATSYDGKANANIWTSIPDAAASVAHYLHDYGWKPNVESAYFVKLPMNNPTIKKLAQQQAYRPLSFWLSQGLAFQLLSTDQIAGLDKTINARLFIPTYYGKADSAFLLTDNFEVLMQWNPSMIEGMMIGILAKSMSTPGVDYNTYKD